MSWYFFRYICNVIFEVWLFCIPGHESASCSTDSLKRRLGLGDSGCLLFFFCGFGIRFGWMIFQ
jgi:hypothetical protein